jgi:cytochrome c556
MAGRRVVLCWLLAAVLRGVGAAQAHQHATGLLKERMDAMDSMAQAMKEIRRQIVGARDFGAVAREAARLQGLAQHLPTWFPPGSNAHPSEALPAIWRQWPVFQASAAALAGEAEKLAQAAASGDAPAIERQYRAVGEVCLACHRQFRAKR